MNSIKDEMINDDELNLSNDVKKRILYKAKMAFSEEPAPKRKRIRLVPILIPTFLCLICFIGLATFLGMKYEYYETVYIDVNPSLELTLNRFDTVVTYDLKNEDSKEVFKEVDFKDKKLDEAVEIVLVTLNDKNILNDSFVNINAISKSEEKTQSLLDVINESVEALRNKYQYVFNYNGEEVTKDEVEQAIESGLNPGKYKLILQLILLDTKLSIQDLKDKSIAELMALLEELLG